MVQIVGSRLKNIITIQTFFSSFFEIIEYKNREISKAPYY